MKFRRNSFIKNAARVSVLIIQFGQLGLLGCGSGVSNLAKTDLSTLVPQLGLSSPTARTTSSSSGLFEKEHFSGYGIDEPTQSAADGTTELKSFKDAKADISATLTKSSATDCFSGVKFATFSKNISCYGPVIAYSSHPDTGTTTACDASTGVSSGNCLPSGDVGIYSATEGTEGEACSSAKMNALVGDVAMTVNSALKLMAGLTCLAGVKGKALPAKDETIDLASDTAAALAGSTFTTAALTRESDLSGTSNPVYKMTVAGILNNSTFSITLRHSPSGGDFKGRLHGYMGTTQNMLKGFSVVYNQTGNTVTYVAKSAQTASSSGTTSLFDTNGDYKYTTFLAGSGNASRDAQYLLSSLNTTTGLGTIYFAWQAGGSDKKARVFQATTQANAGSADTGYAYFGFGPPMSSASIGTIEGMCCNWAGPGGTCIASASAYDASNKAQNQTMTRNTSGIFTPTANAITFAPTTTCNCNAGGLKFGTITQWGTNGSGVTASAVTNNLGSLTAVGTMPTVTAPTF